MSFLEVAGAQSERRQHEFAIFSRGSYIAAPGTAEAMLTIYEMNEPRELVQVVDISSCRWSSSVVKSDLEIQKCVRLSDLNNPSAEDARMVDLFLAHVNSCLVIEA